MLPLVWILRVKKGRCVERSFDAAFKTQKGLTLAFETMTKVPLHEWHSGA